ncbi:peroxiredoxin family protein [Flammeovirga kamogawensis]|uniref:thioredoxin-dependent peroxiredoxin n=1 Tax=Flammeovirga kamogawensis TaxID=373891 RepID=A0ABX8H0Y7_9BACT|nr:peroxiredoxin-like family protein [Flammeovirga kamogawensis]MBB6463300.1 peroxiredoxin [Flammeovirga kamogawensis]QWG09550.1 AhpC/TSA family protein [Flammeovirga kamogawensis]TRX65064.1 AhpC/TSA family protein [Flammeovirga kamogawensis]
MKNLLIILFLIGSIQITSAQETAIYEKYGVTVGTLQPGLKVGESVKNFKGKDQNNKTYSLDQALKNGPVVVNFFRGSWCPYCVKHLINVQDSLSMIEAKGATFIAVTPENQERFTALAEKKGFTFEMVEDKKMDIMNSFEVTFDVNDGYQNMLKKYENDLTKTNAIKKASLPVPATFIISQDGKIIARHYDPNYKVRMSVKDILNTLESI